MSELKIYCSVCFSFKTVLFKAGCGFYCSQCGNAMLIVSIPEDKADEPVFELMILAKKDESVKYSVCSEKNDFPNGLKIKVSNN